MRINQLRQKRTSSSLPFPVAEMAIISKCRKHKLEQEASLVSGIDLHLNGPIQESLTRRDLVDLECLIFFDFNFYIR